MFAVAMEAHSETFRADKTTNLINRLRRNVIRTVGQCRLTLSNPF
jgi:hypothetical protein